MSIRVSSLKKWIISTWQYSGRPATLVKFWAGVWYKIETVVDKIVDLGLKLVAIEGDFTTNSEIITPIKELSQAWYKIVYITDSWDEVWPMVRFKNVVLSILINIPKDWETVEYLPHITSYFREKDEIRFSIKTKWDYNDFREFQKTKDIAAPTKILEVDPEYLEVFKWVLNSDVASMENLIIK